MPLKIKIASILITLSFFYIILDALIQFYIIYPNFIKLERQEALSNMNRCIEAINNEIDHLDNFCHDWSAWDDTYDFINTRSEEYIESNLPQDTFISSHINLIHIINDKRKLIWGKSYNLKNKQEVTIKEFSPEQYEKNNYFFDYADTALPNPKIKKTGIMITQKGPMMFSVRPILNSNHEGPMRGHIIMAKYLNQNLQQQLRQKIKVNFSIQGYHEHEFHNLPEALKRGITKINYTVEIKGDTNWTLFHILPGLIEGSGLLIKINFPRKITQKALFSIRFALISIVLVSIVILIITIFIIHKTIINPILLLTQHTKDIHENRSFLEDIEISRTDEIGELGKNFNQMLSKIRTQTDELIEANLKLGKLSAIDELTGMANRRRFDEKLQTEWKRSDRENIPISLILCDIDHFKKYNDNLGHQAGDYCLKAVAGAIQRAVHRPSDLAARYGGEEFGIVLSNLDSKAAETVAERIRGSVENLGLKHPESSVSDVVTLSLGISTMESTKGRMTNELLERADKALYQAKEKGRNRFVTA